MNNVALLVQWGQMISATPDSSNAPFRDNQLADVTQVTEWSQKPLFLL